MGKQLENRSIKNKLFRSLATFFVICTGILIAVFYFVFRNEIGNLRNAEMSRIVYFYSEKINDVLDEMETICEVISTNYDMQQTIWKEPSETKKIYLQERCNANGRLALLTQSYTKVPYEIAVVLDDGRAFNYSQHSMKRNELGDGDVVSVKEQSWSWENESLIFNSLIGPYLIVQMPIRNLRTNKVCGRVYVELSQSFLLDILNGMNDRNYTVSIKNGETMLLEFGNIQKLQKYSLQKSEELSNGWILEVYLKNNPEIHLVMPIVLYFFLVIFILAVVFVIISSYFRKFITQPLTQLVEKMNHLQIDSLTKPISVDTSLYEVRYLCESYNRMLKRIQSLIDHVKQEEMETQKAQYAVLQAQINPHFLYNTLDTIAWQIRTGEAEAALKNLVDFSRYFRLSLGKGKQIVSLADELEHTRIYLQLMSVRYMGQIKFSITNLDEEVLAYNCPKLILQPIVENSVNHGILERESQSGIITITVQRKKEDIVIEIMDDGVGIEEKQLAQMNYFLENCDKEERRDIRGYGVFNINKRIRLLYGQKYGVRVRSQAGGYTYVRVILPIVRGGQEYAEVNDCG